MAVAVGRSSVVALDPANGEVRWEVVRNPGLVVPPAFAPEGTSGGLVLYVEGAKPSDSALVALDLDTHQRRWRFSLDDFAPWAPAIVGDGVVVGTRGGVVYRVALEDGALQWKSTAEGVVTSVAASADRVFAVSEDQSSGTGSLSSFDASTGQRRWTKSYRLASLVSSPAVAGSTVYAAFGNGLVRAFDAATGQERWSQPIRSRCSPRSGLAVSEGALYVADVQGGVYRFDAETGDRAWDYQFATFTRWGSPLVAAGTVYLGMEEAREGVMAALRASDGHLIWERRTVGGAIGPFAPAGDLLLAPAQALDGGILAFAHDTSGALGDASSPTELHLLAAMVNYCVAFVLVAALLLGLGRFVLRAGPPDELPADDVPAERGEG
jgi:outer membrane protein assembly factor BamB